jgi:hypothetical protein
MFDYLLIRRRGVVHLMACRKVSGAAVVAFQLLMPGPVKFILPIHNKSPQCHVFVENQVNPSRNSTVHERALEYLPNPLDQVFLDLFRRSHSSSSKVALTSRGNRPADIKLHDVPATGRCNG